MLTIQITKRTDGAGVLRCIRANGSVTWQKLRQRHAGFFALHDLTHFAVESTLGFQQGFYGLITQGWEIDDTTGKGSRGPLPDEAVEVEHIVGSFDSERASGTISTAEEFNQYAALQAASAGRHTPRPLSDDDLVNVRRLRGELFAKWFALEPGAALLLQFQSQFGLNQDTVPISTRD